MRPRYRDGVRRIAAVAAVAAAGALAGHAVGYHLARPTHAVAHLTTGHGYSGALAAVVLPLGAAALVALAIRHARRTGGVPGLTVRSLAGVQLGIFLAQELGERLAAGQGLDLARDRGVWWGVIAQVVIAWLLVRALRLGAAIVTWLTRRPKPSRQRHRRPRPVTDPVVALAVAGPRSRAPPALSPR